MVDNIFKYSIRSNHPFFFNQMGMGGTEVIGVLGEAIAAAVNHAMYTYEMAPVTTLMERELIAQLLKLAGFESGDGMFNPGGSMSNAHAMLLARHQASSLTKTEGLHGYSKQLVAFTSAESHYCFERSGLLLGLGTENVIKVPVDDCGIMIPSELERLLEECVAAGKQPSSSTRRPARQCTAQWTPFELATRPPRRLAPGSMLTVPGARARSCRSGIVASSTASSLPTAFRGTSTSLVACRNRARCCCARTSRSCVTR